MTEFTNHELNGFPIKNWRTQIERIIADKAEIFNKKTYNYLKKSVEIRFIR